MGFLGQVGLVRLSWIWYIRLGLVNQVGLLVLVNIALYCSHPDIRVPGGVVCKVIFVSNLTSVEVKLGRVDVVVEVVTNV